MTDITYHSVFQKEFQDLVDLKRALGFEYNSEAAAFKRIDTFFNQNALIEKNISKDLCDSWCRKKSYESINNQSHRISTMRVFCKYLVNLGIHAYVPQKGITKKFPKYEAHIYSDNELKRFFVEVDNSQSVASECPYIQVSENNFLTTFYSKSCRDYYLVSSQNLQ